MKTTFLKYTFLLTVLGSMPWAYASSSLSYSGRLVTPSGAPVSGPVDLRVELGYTTPSGMGPVLCRQDLSSVSLSSGVFHIKIDPDCFPMTFSQVLSSTPDNETLAIKITDLSAGKTYSYQALHSIPYALFSQSAKQLVQMSATSGQVLRWNGSAWAPSDETGTGDGTITQINTGPGLTGGPITNSGTISIEVGGIQDGHLAGNINPSKLAGTRDATKYLKGDNSWASFMADVLGTALNGFVPATGSNVTSADSIIQAMMKHDNQIAGKLDKTGGTLSIGTIDGVPIPTSANQVANKAYVDSQVGGVNASQWIDVAPDDIHFSTGKVGIGTSAPTEKLDVVGNIALNGKLRIQSANLNYVEFKAPIDVTASVVYELPKNKGTAGQALITDNDGKLSWGSASADTSSLADDSIAMSKVNGLTTALSGKENNLPTGGVAGDFLNGLKQWITLDTSSVPENGNLYYKDALARASISVASPAPLTYSSASGVLGFTAPGASGNVLKSDGTNWVSGGIVSGDLPSLDAAKITTGVFPVARGGTGASSFNGSRIVLSTPTALVEAPALINGQLLIGSAGNAPVAANLSAGTGVNITNSAGAITISATGSGGTVTDVTGSAPIVVNNTTSTPSISITKADTAIDGYLSSVDWNTFNNKLGAASTFGGDVSGTAITLTVDRIKNSPILLTAPASGNVLRFDGSNWVNAMLGTTDITAGILPIERGGTNSGTALANNRMMVSSGGKIVEAGALINRQIFIGKTGVAPEIRTLTEGPGVTFNDTGVGTFVISATGTGGTVTNVTGTAPIAVTSNTSTPAITISKADTTNDGYLSSVDWNTFNNKLGTTSAFSGDVSGNYNSTSVDKIKGSPIALAAPASGNVLRFNGTNWVNAMLGTADLTTGILPISRGGTNSGTALANNRIMISSGGSIVEAGALTDRQILIGKTGLTPEIRTLTAGSGVSFNDTGAGVFEISATGKGGTVTSVSVSAPLSIINNTTTPAITLPKSTSAVDGYLSAVDWNTFNNKQNALSVGATINGIVYPALPTQTLQIPLAPVNLTDAVNRQYVDTQVSGAANQWGQSGGNVFRTSGSVGIGTNAPTSLLHLANLAPYITYEELDTTQKFFTGVDSSGWWIRQGATGNLDLFHVKNDGNVGIGTSTPTEKLHVNGKVLATAYEYTSDARLKENIQVVSSPLDKVNKLEGVTFDWRHEEYPERNMPKGRTYGFIAQEVEKHVPELVSTGKDGFKSVQYGNITALLVESIKELFNYSKKESEERKTLERKVASLEEQNHKLQNEVEAIKAQHAKDMEELRQSILELKKK